MLKRLSILITIFCVCFHFLQTPDTSKYNTSNKKIFKYTITDIVDNKSIQEFLTDSINFNPPYRGPVIKLKFAPLHPRIGGLTTQVTDRVYFIQINSFYPLFSARRILMHELVHVFQFEKGWLKELPGGVVLWKDDYYTWGVPWSQRPWEIQAEEWTEELFKIELDK